MDHLLQVEQDNDSGATDFKAGDSSTWELAEEDADGHTEQQPAVGFSQRELALKNDAVDMEEVYF